MSFWVEPATPALTGVKPAGLEGGAVLSGIAGTVTATVAPAVTAPETTEADGPWPQICPLLQNGAKLDWFGAVLPPPGSTAVTRQVLATPEAGTVSVNEPLAPAVVTTTLPGIGPVTWTATMSVPSAVSPGAPVGVRNRPPAAVAGFGGTQGGTVAGVQAVKVTVPVMLPLVAPAWPPARATCSAIEKSCWIGRLVATVPATFGITVKVSECGA